MVSHWSDKKSPLVSSRTHFSLLADLNNDALMISARPVISKSFDPRIDPLVTVPRAPLTIGNNVPYKFHSLFSSLTGYRYISFFPVSFNFTLWSAGTVKFTILRVLFFSYTNGRLVIRLYFKIPYVSVLLFQERFCVVYIPLVRMVKF